MKAEDDGEGVACLEGLTPCQPRAEPGITSGRASSRIFAKLGRRVKACQKFEHGRDAPINGLYGMTLVSRSW